ncbi:cytidine deaminase-like protein [Hypoxylon sp. FL1284]|nr:cytidine deaminase-like protein [Hypoxylon sp. FL1284]
MPRETRTRETMAEHKNSGYAARLWKALFASFIQLLTRLFPFTSTTETCKAQPQPPQQHSHSPPSTARPDLSSLSTSSPHLSTSQPHPAPSSLDVQQGLEQDDTMAPSKKRGQKRRGAKGSDSKAAGTKPPSADASNGTDKSTPSQSQPTAPPSRASLDSIPARATPTANHGDTKANSHQPSGQKPAGPGKPDRVRGTLPPLSSTDNRKENVVPTKTPSSVSQPQSPAWQPLTAEKHDQTQKTGTRIQPATTAPAASSKPEAAENMPLTEQAMQSLTTNVERLSLDDVSNSKKSSQQSVIAVAVPGTVPVPVVVALPFSDRISTTSAKPISLPSFHLPGLFPPETEEDKAEREHHLQFMREALAMGGSALGTNETPVGCVLVYHGKIIAKGMNATNVTRNGTRHAEFMALSALLSRREPGDEKGVNTIPALDHPSWGDVDPSDGHIYPYGQKLHPAPVVDRSILRECILYVTVEPCVMCASLLRQLGIKKVYFGAVNDKFGGTGGVFRIHLNSKPVPTPEDRPYQNGYGPPDLTRVVKGRPTLVPREWEDGDGGNVENGYHVEGGYLRDEAVSLLRRFYVQENGRAPQPRKKEGRAARLFAMENQAKMNGSGSDLSDTGAFPDALPTDVEAPMDDDEGMEMANGGTAVAV